jgi:hypothetical protein
MRCKDARVGPLLVHRAKSMALTKEQTNALGIAGPRDGDVLRLESVHCARRPADRPRVAYVNANGSEAGRTPEPNCRVTTEFRWLPFPSLRVRGCHANPCSARSLKIRRVGPERLQYAGGSTEVVHGHAVRRWPAVGQRSTAGSSTRRALITERSVLRDVRRDPEGARCRRLGWAGESLHVCLCGTADAKPTYRAILTYDAMSAVL